MGLCSSVDDEYAIEKKFSKEIDSNIRNFKNKDDKVYKLLLLGTGESGKTTILKQMKLIYQSQYSEPEKKSFREIIRRNLLECILQLINGMQKLGWKEKEDSKSQEYIEYLKQFDLTVPFVFEKKMTDAISYLWKNETSLSSVLRDYHIRSKLHIFDSVTYFFEPKNLERIAEPDYTPDEQDILRARNKTSGIVERLIEIKDVRFKVIDVGGQRNERRKWINCFENVTAIIFVCAVQEYDQVLAEDEKTNRLHESLKVFDETINKYFDKITIILFLNKLDLFEEKIKQVSLNTCFNDFDEQKHATTQAKIEFIQNKFRSKLDKKGLFFTHCTVGVNTENVKKVWDATQITILNNSLQERGLY